MTNPVLRVRSAGTVSGEYPARKFAPDERREPHRRRAGWRQKLVDAERGLAQSLRADSTLYLHVFLDCLLLAVCGVLGLSATHWAIVAAGLTAMLSAELFSQGLRIVASELSPLVQKQSRAVNAAARLLVILGCSLMIVIILWLRLRELFGS